MLIHNFYQIRNCYLVNDNDQDYRKDSKVRGQIHEFWTVYSLFCSLCTINYWKIGRKKNTIKIEQTLLVEFNTVGLIYAHTYPYVHKTRASPFSCCLVRMFFSKYLNGACDICPANNIWRTYVDLGNNLKKLILSKQCFFGELSSNSRQLCYIHLHANRLWKGMNSFLSLSYGLNSWTFIWNDHCYSLKFLISIFTRNKKNLTLQNVSALNNA